MSQKNRGTMLELVLGTLVLYALHRAFRHAPACAEDLPDDGLDLIEDHLELSSMYVPVVAIEPEFRREHPAESYLVDRMRAEPHVLRITALRDHRAPRSSTRADSPFKH